MFSIVVIPVYIPTKGARRFPFLHTLFSIICRFIDDGYSD